MRHITVQEIRCRKNKTPTIRYVRWRYKVGTSHLVVQQPQSRRKHVIELWRLLGYDTRYDWQRDREKNSRFTHVTPRIVADFIRNATWYATASPNLIAQRYVTFRLMLDRDEPGVYR